MTSWKSPWLASCEFTPFPGHSSELEVNELIDGPKKHEHHGDHQCILGNADRSPDYGLLDAGQNESADAPGSGEDEHQHGRNEVVIFPEVHSQECGGIQESTVHHEGVGEGFGAEGNPAHHGDAQYQRPGDQGMGQNGNALGEWAAFPFQEDEGGMIEPPEDEGPIGAMPESHDGPRGEQCQISAPGCRLMFEAFADSPLPGGLGHFDPGQGEVEVIPNPAGEGDVPTLPELAQRGRDVRVVEVFRDSDAEYEGGAQCDVGIGGEIEIDLESKQEGQGQHVNSR